MKKIFHILSLLLCVFFNAQQQLFYRQFTMEDGLPNNTIYDVKEDLNGNIIIGTDNGLSVFNGTTFKNFAVKDGLYNPYVTSIHAAQNGEIYVYTYNGMIQKFDGKKFHDSKITLNNDAEFSTDYETLFVQRTFSSTLKDDRSFSSIVLLKYLRKDYQNTFYFTAYLKKDYPRILPFYFQNNQLITTKDNTAYFGSRIAIFPKVDGYFYRVIFRKKDMVYLMKDKMLTADFQGNIKSEIKIPFEISVEKKYHFMLDHNDDLWANFQRKGLYKLVGGKLVNCSSAIGLSPNQNVNNLFCDSKGRIWIATFDKGLLLIKNPGVKHFFSGKTEQNYTSFILHPEHGLIASSRFNLYQVQNDSLVVLPNLHGGELVLSYLDSKPIITTINALFKTKSNERIRQNYIKNIPAIWGTNPFRHRNFLVTHSKNAISVTDKNLIMSTMLSKTSKGEEKPYPEFIGRVQNLIPYQSKILYNDGKSLKLIDIIKVKDTIVEFKLVKKLDFKTKDFISTVIKKNEDTVLFATGNTLYTMVNEKITDSIISVNTKNFGYVNKIVPRGNEIWLCSQNGLFKIDRKNGSRIFNKYNLLSDNEVNDIIFHGDYLYVATKNGITKIPFEETEKATDKPKILYFSYKTAEEDQPVLNNTIKLKSKENFLKIFMNIQNFISPHNMIIQYKTDDSEWNSTSNNYLDFPSLSSGKHLLEIQIRNLNSDWNRYQITINKDSPYYAKWWFVLLAVFLPLFVIFAALFYQFRRKEREKKEKLENENKILELKQQALFAMMNPHFVFNALNAIQYFINSSQKEKGSEYLAKFAKLTREVLNQADKSFLNISEEINRLKMYVELEQLRFQNFEFEIMVDSQINAETTKIPNMMIQPFIENAILHGVSPLRTNDGKIILSFSKKENQLFIQITDNGVGKNETRSQSKHASKGINMIRERFKILNRNNLNELYKVSESVASPNSEREGHKVCIEIPMILEASSL